jgi:hypothetical protein
MQFVGHLTLQQVATPGTRSQRQHTAPRDREVLSVTSNVIEAIAVTLRRPRRGRLEGRWPPGGPFHPSGLAPLAPPATTASPLRGDDEPPLVFFAPVPFPLRPKTHYGAARFAFGEVKYVTNIKGLAWGLRLWRVA